MKKNRCANTLSAVLVSSLFLSAICASLPAGAQEQQPAEPAASVSMSAGLTVFYAWWDPVWENFDQTSTSFIIRSLTGYWTSRQLDWKMDGGGVLVAPSVSVKLNPEWNLTCNFLFGRYAASADYLILGSPLIIPLTLDLHAWKFDADFLLGYRVSDSLRLFFGPKFQGYSYNMDSDSLFAALMPNIDAFFFSGGLGCGASFTIQLYQNLYLLPTVSLFTLIGGGSIKGSGFGSGDYSTQTSVAVGANAIASLAYYIESISTTVSLGFRMQYLYYFSKPTEMYVDDGDFFYGIHLSAVYNF
jgi:hypothetical protein